MDSVDWVFLFVWGFFLFSFWFFGRYILNYPLIPRDFSPLESTFTAEQAVLSAAMGTGLKPRVSQSHPGAGACSSSEPGWEAGLAFLLLGNNNNHLSASHGGITHFAMTKLWV